MAIVRYPYSDANVTIAESTAQPRQVWINAPKEIVVYTGADMTPVVIDADKEAVKSYAKLVALKNMTPAQVSSWVDANVTNLSQAQDAIKTLAIGMGYIIRQIF
jgi:hypothetical protein